MPTLWQVMAECQVTRRDVVPEMICGTRRSGGLDRGSGMIKCSSAAEVALDGLPPCCTTAEGAWIPATRDVPLASGFGCYKFEDNGGSATCPLALEVDLPKNAKEEGKACRADKKLCDLCPCVCLCDVSVLNKSPEYVCVEGVTVEGEGQINFTILSRDSVDC
uniref:Uncharacterized protein n=1 Tax=Ditylenchus dipsaci TaxID=166011 RepID=A0A915D793_9BILA